MKADALLIRNGLVIDPDSGMEGLRDVLVRGGKVAAVARDFSRSSRLPPGTVTLEARGCWVVPGLIDLHVHLREPGGEQSETIASGTRAAARGGVTTLVAMPNTRPVPDTPARLRRLRERIRRDAVVNVLPCAAVTDGQAGSRLADLEGLARAGAAAFSDDGRPVSDPRLMEEALFRAGRLGLPVLDHAEDPVLTGVGVVRESPASRRARWPGIPAESESAMALRDIALARRSGGRLHVCHVSCAQTLAVLRWAKCEGLPVTAEAAPHHFTLSLDDIPYGSSRRAADFKMKPPLGTPEDRNALQTALADGTLDAIATDHAPHAPEAKACGVLRAPFGVIGLETLVPLSLELVRRGVLGRRRLIELLSAGPARVLGLRAKGSLRRGADGDVTVIDPAASFSVDGDFASASRNSPFIGRVLRGAVRATVVAGRLVYFRKDGGRPR